MGHPRTRQQDPGYPAREPGTAGTRDVYQAQLQRCQDQIHDLIINRHIPRANDPGKV